MTVIGRQLAIQPEFREAKLGIMCVGTKFDCRLFSPFWQKWVKLAGKASLKIFLALAILNSKPFKSLAANNTQHGAVPATAKAAYLCIVVSKTKIIKLQSAAITKFIA